MIGKISLCLVFEILLSMPCFAAGVSIDIDIIDKNGKHSAYHDDIKKCLSAAMKIIADEMDIVTNVRIKALVEIATKEEYPGMAGGGGAQSICYMLKRADPSGNIYMQGLHAAIVSPDFKCYTTYHFKFIINNELLKNRLWFDPEPYARKKEIPPGNMVDALSMFMHEILHSLAFNGWLNNKTGKSISVNGAKSVYDENIIMKDGQLYFDGKNARKVFGGPIPLTHANYTHYGNNDAEGISLKTHIMYGEWVSWRMRCYISELDLAILKDCGLPVKKKFLPGD